MPGAIASDRSRRDGLIERIAELLKVTYRSADLGNLNNPLDETIYIMLARKTREGVYRKVFAEIKRSYPRWEDVARAPEAELRAVLCPSGLVDQRLGQLTGLLEAVAKANEEHATGPFGNPAGDLTLDFLSGMNDQDAEQFLKSLPGIGPKVARCILSYSLDRATFAVDTHVHRIFTRLEIVKSRGRKADHDPFQKVVPPKLRKQLHINLIHHGRAVCRSKSPACAQCVLISFCKEGRSRAAKAANPGEPVGIDLFAGAGGLSEGFAREGFRIALAVEADRHAAQTFRANHPGVPVLEKDVTTLSARQIRKEAVAAKRIDAVIAGPPCQGYSAAGKRVPGDGKNLLFRHVVRLAKDLRAEFVVMENVPGLQRVNGREFMRRILDYMRSYGFSASRHLLSAEDYGVPQRRKRYFFLARRKGTGTRPDRPAPTVAELEAKALRKRLERLPELDAGVRAEYYPLADGSHLLNGTTMRHSEKVKKKIGNLKPGEGPISYRRLEDDAARTLIAGHRALPVHPWLHRTISVREAACIQGFRDDYVFCGPPSEQPLQVANAVPPSVAAAVARSVRERWEEGRAALSQRKRSRRAQ